MCGSSSKNSGSYASHNATQQFPSHPPHLINAHRLLRTSKLNFMCIISESAFYYNNMITRFQIIAVLKEFSQSLMWLLFIPGLSVFGLQFKLKGSKCQSCEPASCVPAQRPQSCVGYTGKRPLIRRHFWLRPAGNSGETLCHFTQKATSCSYWREKRENILASTISCCTQRKVRGPLYALT